jgi:replicative DNA helicase
MKINAGEFDGASGLLDYAEMKILSIRPKRSGNDVGIKQLVQDALEDIENTIKLDGKISGMSTGLYDLDQATDGIHPGEMIVIAAFPSVGKTSLAMNIAENACLELGESVGVFSLEMMSVQLVKRAIMSHARVSLKNLRNGFLAATDFPKLSRAAAKLSIAKIFIDDTAGLSVYEMRARARRMSQEHGVKLFVVDYIQLMNAMGGPRRPENRQQEVALISNGIKEMAKELNAGVLVLSQLNDDGKLKESRAIGADADGLWELTRQDPSDEDRANGTESVTLCAKKQRNGERGKRVPLTFFPSMTRFDCPGRIYASDLEQQNLQAYRQTSPDP